MKQEEEEPAEGTGVDEPHDGAGVEVEPPVEQPDPPPPKLRPGNPKVGPNRFLECTLLGLRPGNKAGHPH